MIYLSLDIYNEEEESIDRKRITYKNYVQNSCSNYLTIVKEMSVNGYSSATQMFGLRVARLHKKEMKLCIIEWFSLETLKNLSFNHIVKESDV